jgi:phytoene dehydrogenase-like protein
MTSPTRRDFLRAASLVPVAVAGFLDNSTANQATPNSSQANGRSRSTDRFDYVLAGAGHNSLICAAYLARAGYRVLVLEGRATIGGGCKTAEILLPGFKEDLCSSAHSVIARSPILRDNELGLERYGYELLHPDVVLHYPFLDGASMTVYRNDPERTAATIAEVSKKDAETFTQMASERARVKAMSPADAAKTRSGLYFQRLGALTGYAAAKEVWESRYMRAASLSGGRFFGTPGSDVGSGGQAFSMMDHMAGRPIPKGGSGMLTVALGRLIEAHDGVILTGKPVARLVIEGGQCKGVECVDGSQFRAEKGVVSTIHIKHLIDMAPRELWGDSLLDDVALMQPELAMFQFHYAFSEAPTYRLAANGTVSSCEASIMQYPESIFALNSDDAHGELHLDDCALQIVHPAVFDASRVPPGQGLLKIEGVAPYKLKEGPEHWDAIKEHVAETIVTHYLKHTSNLSKGKILAQFLLSPLDIERMNPAMWRGSVHHFDNRWGNFAPYRLPIPGLYQTGACTAPGGSISGMPGRNTAAVILQDEGKTLQQAIGAERGNSTAGIANL